MNVIIMSAPDYSERYLFYKDGVNPIIRKQKISKREHRWKDVVDWNGLITNRLYVTTYEELKNKGYIRLDTTLDKIEV
jgi:hypothetical protein